MSTFATERFDKTPQANVVHIRRGGLPIARARQPASEHTVSFLASTNEFNGGKTRFQTYWEHTAECLFAVRVTSQGGFVFEGVNPANERVSGLTNVMVAGKGPHECFSAEMANEVTAHYRDCVSAEETIQYEEVLKLPGGVKRWQTTLSPMRDPGTGRITLILGSAHDITPTYRANAQTERGRRLLERIEQGRPDFSYIESVINAMSSVIAILGEDGRIVVVNEAWRRFVRRPDGRRFGNVEGLVYTTPSNLSPQRSDAPKLRAGLKSVMAGSVEAYRLTYRARSDVKSWFRVTANRYESDGWIRIVLAHEDVSDLHLALQSVSDLSQKLNNIQEEERQRIACELHDSTSQHLTAVSLNMISLRKQFNNGATSHPLLDEIERSVDEAQKEIRIFSYLLHPPYLDRDGLKVTLERFVAGFVDRTAIAADVRIGTDVDDVSFPLQRSVLRIVQEALTNVHRHANARHVTVSLCIRRDRLILLVGDDGRGIKASHHQRRVNGVHRGVGLSGMHARVHQFGGKLTIHSGSSGTKIRTQIPLSPAHD
jgi:PAS domain S-box-containing protein